MQEKFVEQYQGYSLIHLQVSAAHPSLCMMLTLKLQIAQVKDGGKQFGDFPGIIL